MRVAASAFFVCLHGENVDGTPSAIGFDLASGAVRLGAWREDARPAQPPKITFRKRQLATAK